MDAYERLIRQMRQAGKYYNDPPLQMGIVGKNGTIKIDDLELDTEDYLMDCNLRMKENALKQGDQVVVSQLNAKGKGDNESELFVVLAKVVSAK